MQSIAYLLVWAQGEVHVYIDSRQVIIAFDYGTIGVRVPHRFGRVSTKKYFWPDAGTRFIVLPNLQHWNLFISFCTPQENKNIVVENRVENVGVSQVLCDCCPLVLAVEEWLRVDLKMTTFEKHMISCSAFSDLIQQKISEPSVLLELFI